LCLGLDNVVERIFSNRMVTATEFCRRVGVIRQSEILDAAGESLDVGSGRVTDDGNDNETARLVTGPTMIWQSHVPIVWDVIYSELWILPLCERNGLVNTRHSVESDRVLG
jgi:hypothetical protein